MSLVVLALLLLAPLASPLPTASICALPYCECTNSTHPSWTTVNCTVPSDKKLDIWEGDLPETMTDLLINGAEAVQFGANSLSRLKDARRIQIIDSKLLLLRKFAAVNLNVVNVFLEVEGSDIFRIEERAFTNLKGPLSVSIKNCDVLSIAGEAFSWLLLINISDIRQLQLGPGSFMLDPTVPNVGDHGPGMKIVLRNLTVTEFTSQTFGSSAAEITFDSIHVGAIRPDTFTANTYTVLTANNCIFDLIDKDAFAQKSLINSLVIEGCKIKDLSSGAIQSAVENLNITHSKFKNINAGAIKMTAVTISITGSNFSNFEEKGFEFTATSKLFIEGCIFDEMKPDAISVQDATLEELVFAHNDIETIDRKSLGIFSKVVNDYKKRITYKNNYFGKACYCNVTEWLSSVLNLESVELYSNDSFCTVNDIFARCFNVPEQNMLMKNFEDSVCGDDVTIQCEPYKTKTDGETTEIKNPKFPHKKEEEGLTHRNAKVIGIVIVTIFGCIIIALLFSLYKWLRRKGYCLNFKNFLVSSNSSCASFCDRFCICSSHGIDNARSISQLSVHEYSERRRLNEPRIQDTILPDMYSEPTENTNTVETAVMDDKTTQTLPEELTKELLESLKQKLDDPDNYVEAREMIEHLYELIKVEENCNSNTPTILPEENIYELPFQNTAPRIGKNKKQMISVGTRTPSLDKLSPLSPYNRQTALAHEYFEPKDFAVHLYAEIANNDRDKKIFMNKMPDVVSDQAIPRGPYLRAVREKMVSPSSSPLTKSLNNVFVNSPSVQDSSTLKSNKSTSSNSSGKMVNRPLPEKPLSFDPGEGTSFTRR